MRTNNTSNGRFQWPPPTERFWAHVDKSDPSGCWLWTGTKMSTGYGLFGHDGRPGTAHRFSYRLAHGEVNGSVLHRCDNRACVNPAHLFLGAQKDNVADMVAKGRQAKGENVGRAKLTSAQVWEIKKRLSRGERVAKIARDFPTHISNIYYIARGVTWRHIEVSHG